MDRQFKRQNSGSCSKLLPQDRKDCYREQQGVTFMWTTQMLQCEPHCDRTPEGKHGQNNVLELDHFTYLLTYLLTYNKKSIQLFFLLPLQVNMARKICHGTMQDQDRVKQRRSKCLGHGRGDRLPYRDCVL